MTAYPEHPVTYPVIIIYQHSATVRLISIGQPSFVYDMGLTIDVLSLNTKERDTLTDDVLSALYNGYSTLSDYHLEFAGINGLRDNPTGAKLGKKIVHRKTVETRWKIYVI